MDLNTENYKISTSNKVTLFSAHASLEDPSGIRWQQLMCISQAVVSWITCNDNHYIFFQEVEDISNNMASPICQQYSAWKNFPAFSLFFLVFPFPSWFFHFFMTFGLLLTFAQLYPLSPNFSIMVHSYLFLPLPTSSYSRAPSSKESQVWFSWLLQVKHPHIRINFLIKLYSTNY